MPGLRTLRNGADGRIKYYIVVYYSVYTVYERNYFSAVGWDFLWNEGSHVQGSCGVLRPPGKSAWQESTSYVFSLIRHAS